MKERWRTDMEILDGPKPPIYHLQDGVLYDATGNTPFPDADYFSDIDEAIRWLDENQIDAAVVEGK